MALFFLLDDWLVRFSAALDVQISCDVGITHVTCCQAGLLDFITIIITASSVISI